MLGLNINHASPVFALSPSVTVDSYGDPTESWANPTRIRLRGASLESPATDESETVDIDTLRNSRVLMVPSRTALTSRDRVEAEGDIWRVDGEPIVRVGALDTFTRVALRRVVKVGAHA